jgi:hypothetical protein
MVLLVKQRLTATSGSRATSALLLMLSLYSTHALSAPAETLGTRRPPAYTGRVVTETADGNPGANTSANTNANPSAVALRPAKAIPAVSTATQVSPPTDPNEPLFHDLPPSDAGAHLPNAPAAAASASRSELTRSRNVAGAVDNKTPHDNVKRRAKAPRTSQADRRLTSGQGKRLKAHDNLARTAKGAQALPRQHQARHARSNALQQSQIQPNRRTQQKQIPPLQQAKQPLPARHVASASRQNLTPKAAKPQRLAKHKDKGATAAQARQTGKANGVVAVARVTRTSSPRTTASTQSSASPTRRAGWARPPPPSTWPPAWPRSASAC